MNHLTSDGQINAALETAEDRHIAFTLHHYAGRRDVCAADLRSAYGDAAHMCDSIAVDIRKEHTSRGRVTKRGEELSAAVKRAGDAIWRMRELVK